MILFGWLKASYAVSQVKAHLKMQLLPEIKFAD